jgi:VanZ family protein
MSFKQYLLRWLPVIVWMGAIFLFSHQPADHIRDFGLLNLPIKKGAHMVGYALLALLAQRAVGDSNGRTWLPTLLLIFLYAISDEFHQTFVPGRNGTPLDVLIDGLGGTLGLLGRRYLYRPKQGGLVGHHLAPFDQLQDGQQRHP